jgi:hypothetical protein
MNNLLPRKVALFAVVSIFVFQYSTYGCSWIRSPSIDVDNLYQQYDQDWFHISQCCWLAIIAEDYDTYCTPWGDIQYGNYFSGSASYWYGDNLDYTSGTVNRWKADHFTDSPNEVYAYANDNPYYPDGPRTDDYPVRTPSAYLNAWEVKVTMTAEGSSYVCTETGYGPSAETEAYHECSLDGGPTTAQTYVPGYNHDGPHTFDTVQINTSWTMEPIPSSAETYTATGWAYVDAYATGTLYAYTDDDDYEIFSGGDISISVGATIPPFSVSISWVPELSSECEACAAIAFGADSDILDKLVDPGAPKIAIVSSDNPNIGMANIYYSEAAGLSGSLSAGITKGVELLINGVVEAKGDDPYNSDAEIESSGSAEFVTASLIAENLHLAEDGRENR